MSGEHVDSDKLFPLYMILLSIITLALVVYILHKAFKCYLKCTNRGTYFKAGFRDDSSTTCSPLRQDSLSEPRTPPDNSALLEPEAV